MGENVTFPLHICEICSAKLTQKVKNKEKILKKLPKMPKKLYKSGKKWVKMGQNGAIF